MAKIRRSIEIDCDVERVFEFVNDAHNLPEVWPSLIEVSNVTEDDQGRPSFDWVYKMLGIRFRGHTDTTAFDVNERVVSRGKGGIESQFEYLYEGVDGGTRLTVEIEYSIPNQLLNKLAEPVIRRLNEHEAEILLDNIKDRLELADVVRSEERPEAPVH